jgi:hypothetical protein
MYESYLGGIAAGDVHDVRAARVAPVFDRG